MRTTEAVQQRLLDLGYDVGDVDGDFGPRSIRALRRFQYRMGIGVDGIYGRQTEAALFSDGAARADPPFDRAALEIVGAKPGAASLVWPLQRDVERVFGPPAGPDASAGVCHLPFPFRLAWNLDETVNTFACHRLVATYFSSLFRDVADYYGRDAMTDLRLDVFSGCYSPRKMQGGDRWSMHAWGIAVDIDDSRNRLRQDATTASLAGDVYRPFWDLVESYGFTSLGRERNFDWMHFQAARLG